VPGSIQKFFWVASAILFAGIAITAAGDLRQLADTLSVAQVCFMALFQTAYYAILFALIWLVARRATNWARWVYVGLALFTLQDNIWPLAASEVSSLGVLTLAQGILKIVSIGLLFTTAAGEWFNPKKPTTDA